MKIWLFALIQSLIAVLGLAAYFVADNIYLASAAAVLAGAVGIAQPILAAYRGSRIQKYQDKLYDQSVVAVDEQIEQMQADLIPLQLPHEETVKLLLKQTCFDRADRIMNDYSEILGAIEHAKSDASELVSRFQVATGPTALGAYLAGFVAYHHNKLDESFESFELATRLQPGWITPWLGWAIVLHHQQQWDTISDKHPHVNGVELLPYDVGDQETFLELGEESREKMVEHFQEMCVALGSYYSISEMMKSRQKMIVSRDEWRKVA